MTQWPPFRLAETPLAEGVWLIQASAGTGKTFTIAGLVLRLLLERDFSIRDILVVTFTEAATGELRDRVRRTLADALRVLDGAVADNPAVPEILAFAKVPPKVARLKLERALRAFDEASIYTIHSFCQRALKDRAFESGELFDIELLTDESDLLQEVADDFWRRHFYEADPLIVNFLLKNERSPERLADTLRLHTRNHELRVISAVDDRTFDSLLSELMAAFSAARSLWNEGRDAILAALGIASNGSVTTPPAWAKEEHAKTHLFNAALAGIERSFSDAGPTSDTLAAIKFFASQTLEKSTKAKSTTPDHAFFQRCAEVLAAEANFLVGLQLEFLKFARLELPRRKQELKVQCFDDLLTRLRAALRSDRGPLLAGQLRGRYRAALIDEFQDTDPVQWEIFHTLFGKTDSTGEDPTTKHSGRSHFLFLIGDPKQSIYGFRGADIFTYLDAARAVQPERGFTLHRNWRSETPLVTAVNAIFEAAPNPFAFEEILFQPVTPAGDADKKPLTEGDRRLSPMRLWFVPRPEGQKSIARQNAEEHLASLVANEIVRLLNGDTHLELRKLAPRDIAVLVPMNRQAEIVQEALRHVGVPSVLHTEESVFTSLEARELERVLAALAQPGHERALRAALATDLLGLNGTMLDALIRDGAAWEARLERFRALHALWIARGFMPMFRQWLHKEDVRQRLLGFDDGERRLTNLLHLAEVLHATAHEQRLGPAGLVRWLDEQISSPDPNQDEHQLRLERDDDAVRLVTIHKSKGLEYPVVFCPFSWKASDIKRNREDQVFFHERSGGRDGLSQFVHDLGSPDYDAHRQLAFHEKLMENLRQLYVALTRARNRCYFVWGAFRGAETSAAAWLLHHPPVTLPDRNTAAQVPEVPIADLNASMKAHFEALADEAILADLERLVERARTAAGSTPGEIDPIEVQILPEPGVGLPAPVRYIPPPSPEAELVPRRFLRSVSTQWRITSFSGLIADRNDEQPDHDAETQQQPAPEPAPATGFFAFPRGTQAGTCLHKVFEDLHFARASDDTVLNPLVERNLRRHGIDAAFAPSVIGAVRRTLSVPLEPAPPGFTLSGITEEERINELEFCLPLRELTPALLRTGLAAAGEDVANRLNTLGFRSSAGFVRGFIDLVFRKDGRFHIVDWKSNGLGNQSEDYGPAKLRSEMVRRFYVLQYHLYSLALHEHLKLRLPGYQYEQHMGGVYYLFLRGIDPTRPELGVFRDRPAASTIETLSQSILAKAEIAR